MLDEDEDEEHHKGCTSHSCGLCTCIVEVAAVTEAPAISLPSHLNEALSGWKRLASIHLAVTVPSQSSDSSEIRAQ
jgi:hypothetical protein